ncbi:protein BCCIP homolog [Rhododendron vialii]|uniref:protein BCCIP homolog n=1 Tax=Rhododendron vialii TaxID=182163 RepID=UPI00265F285F|nr:protein BCCIP homolog [Rhododendron vialii]XP_058214913.1 protein BCCIP homolog [Rhododendron vialii]XP_058214919.1 protein BCCIP homolog [Rhododendron vialii]XP_058214927.1 protein BCCIP homolog [Rhododendron vialii]XP_058214935.1 protein BCCIP homolog [Rhododendron vialii]
MPRKLTRRHRFSKPRPFTFSPFARSAAQVAMAFKVKRQIQNSKFQRKSSPTSAGGKFPFDASKDKKSESGSSDEGEFEGVVQADFAFFDPKPDDFHGVKGLLQTYIDNKQWDLSGFVDLILGQTTVGTIVKIEDDEDDTPYSLVTALNLGRYKDHRCMKELKEYLLKVCKEEDVLNNLRSFLGAQAQNVGLLVSQRVVNLPPQLLPPLYDALFDEVSWATEDEPTKELRKSFCFKHYVLVTKIYEHKNAGQKEGASSSIDEAIIYTKPEDEIIHQLSSWSFRFPLLTQQLPTHELRSYRLVGLLMALEAEKVPTFRQQLHSLINES